MPDRSNLSTDPTGGDAPRRRILIVDDHAPAAEVLAEVLAELGPYDVVTAADGPTALDIARTVRPDIILLDLGLPEMDGFEVAKCIRAEPALRHVHLVALTGFDTEEDRRRVAEAGFAYHLAKPPSVDNLQQLLARLATVQ